MFGLFKKKKEKPHLIDIDNNVIFEGDLVEALRYDLGECTLEMIDGTFFYVSSANKEKVIYLKMIDASTENQKVRKISR